MSSKVKGYGYSLFVTIESGRIVLGSDGGNNAEMVTPDEMREWIWKVDSAIGNGVDKRLPDSESVPVIKPFLEGLRPMVMVIGRGRVSFRQAVKLLDEAEDLCDRLMDWKPPETPAAKRRRLRKLKQLEAVT